MDKWKIDVPVYLNFFNRPDNFKQVFEAVRQAKPSKLFLACDGPREKNYNDVQMVRRCQQIAENVDWECEVYKNYSEVNLGCGKRMYTGISWAFEFVDRLIILEDDCVPCQAFFLFCEELLEKYKYDIRIYMISAMNHLGVYEKTPYDYFFARGCIWGWATWKRSWDQVDYNLGFLEDEYAMQCLQRMYPYYSNAINMGMQKKKILDEGGRLSAWSYQSAMAFALNNQVNIVPKYNMITNVGLSSNGVHTAGNIKTIPKKSRAYYDAKTYDISFPMKHPKYVVEDRIYHDEVEKKFNLNIFDKIEYIVRIILFGEKKDIKRIVTKFVLKMRRSK